MCSIIPSFFFLHYFNRLCYHLTVFGFTLLGLFDHKSWNCVRRHRRLWIYTKTWLRRSYNSSKWTWWGTVATNRGLQLSGHFLDTILNLRIPEFSWPMYDKIRCNIHGENVLSDMQHRDILIVLHIKRIRLKVVEILC